IETRDRGAASCEADRIQAEMALQMSDAKSPHIADLGGLDGIELVAAIEHFLDVIEPRLVAAMDRHAFVPALAVGIEIDLLVHGRLCMKFIPLVGRVKNQERASSMSWPAPVRKLVS